MNQEKTNTYPGLLCSICHEHDFSIRKCSDCNNTICSYKCYKERQCKLCKEKR